MTFTQQNTNAEQEAFIRNAIPMKELEKSSNSINRNQWFGPILAFIFIIGGILALIPLLIWAQIFNWIFSSKKQDNENPEKPKINNNGMHLLKAVIWIWLVYWSSMRIIQHDSIIPTFIFVLLIIEWVWISIPCVKRIIRLIKEKR